MLEPNLLDFVRYARPLWAWSLSAPQPPGGGSGRGSGGRDKIAFMPLCLSQMATEAIYTPHLSEH